MSETKKPRIAEILGVEVGERFSVEGQRNRDPLYVDEDGWVRWESDDSPSLSAVKIAINHPDRIIRKPRFTQQEVEDAKTLLRIFPEQLDSVSRANDGTVTLKAKGAWRGYLNSDAFPSIRPGQSYTLDEIIGGAE